jgi:hypothetical protein
MALSGVASRFSMLPDDDEEASWKAVKSKNSGAAINGDKTGKNAENKNSAKNKKKNKKKQTSGSGVGKLKTETPKKLQKVTLPILCLKNYIFKNQKIKKVFRL